MSYRPGARNGNADGLFRLTADDDRVTGEGGRSVVDQDPVNH